MSLQEKNPGVFFRHCHRETIFNDRMREMSVSTLKTKPWSRQGGVNLIELMISVAIVGIIGAVAYPSYKQYIVKSNRAGAQAHLMDIAQAEQQYLADNRAYTTILADLNGMTTPSEVAKYYTITITTEAGPPPKFTVEAKPKSGTNQEGDATLTIDNTGKKTPPEKW